MRRAGEPQSWLINKTHRYLGHAADAWLRKEIINVAADRVQSATVTTKGGEALHGREEKRAPMPNFAVDRTAEGQVTELALRRQQCRDRH